MASSSSSTGSCVEETTRDEAMWNLLEDDALSDLALRSTCDLGKSVKCSRNMLAARSPVFRRMLYGPFREGSSQEIELPFPTVVLLSIVMYIYKDIDGIYKTVDGMTVFLEESDLVRSSEANSNKIKKELDLLAKYAAAAEYFCLSRLSQKIQTHVKDLIRIRPSLACWVLTVRPSLQDLPEPLQQFAFDTLRVNPRPALTGAPLQALSGDLLKQLLLQSRPKGVVHELDLFCAVAAWAADQPERVERAKELVRYIHLDRLSAADVSTFVAPSGLLSTTKPSPPPKDPPTEPQKTPETADAEEEDLWKDAVIVVSGAGASYVDGIYTQQGRSYGGKSYYYEMLADVVMEGDYGQDEPGELRFELSQKTEGGLNYWTIADTTYRDLGCKSNRYYESDKFAMPTEFPVCSDWKLAEERIPIRDDNPPPRVELGPPNFSWDPPMKSTKLAGMDCL